MKKISKILTGAAVLTGLAGAGIAVLDSTENGAGPGSAAAVADAKPGPEAGDPTGPRGGPAFERNGTGIPIVGRGKGVDKDKRVPGTAGKFGGKVTYEDGVTVTTGGFGRGTVTDEGAGIVKGAEYVLVDVTVTNGSDQELDLTAVVPTMVYGKGQAPAAPLYDGVEVGDFAEEVPAGSSVEASYAFQVPASATNTLLQLDIDGVHDPAVFSGKLP
jgi:hypothetical protein